MNTIKLFSKILDDLQQYGEYYNQKRAIPDIYSGLKPVQRKLLYACSLLGVKSSGKLVKALTVPGRAMSFYQHGDAALESALTRMGQNFKMGNPLIFGGGSWGLHSNLYMPDAGAAALRYRELRLMPLAEELLKSVKQKIVPMELSFDKTIEEPTHLWANLPMFLLFAQSGIGVGKSTSYPAFTHESVVKFTKKVVEKRGEIDDTDLAILKLLFWQQPVIINKSQIVSILNGTSKQKSIKLRAKFTQRGNTLIVSNFPQSSCPKTVIDTIEKVVASNPTHIFSNIVQTLDASKRVGGEEKVLLELDLKPRTDIEKLIAELCEKTTLETYVPFNLVLLDKFGKATKFTVPQAIKQWYELFCEKSQTLLKHQIADLQIEVERLQGLIKCLSEIDIIIELIKQSADKNSAKETLMERGYTAIQSEAILALRLVKLANLEQQKLANELAETQAKLLETQETLNKPDKFANYLITLSKQTADAIKTPSKMCEEIDDERVKLKEEQSHYVKIVGRKLDYSPKNKTGYTFYNKNQPICVVSDNITYKLTDDNIPPTADIIFNKNTEGVVLTITKDGYVKRTIVETAWSERKAKLINSNCVLKSLIAQPDQTLELGLKNGATIEIKVSDLSSSGRNTKGKRVVKQEIKTAKIKK